MENIWRASVVLFCLRCQVNGSFLIMFLSVIQGENPSVQSRQLYALSYAWSSNLLDYLTTLALIQSNNGEPNWGPNHATSTQLSYWIGLAPLALTSHSSLVQNPGRLHKCPMWNPSAYHILIYALQASFACRYEKPADAVCWFQISPTHTL